MSSSACSCDDRAIDAACPAARRTAGSARRAPSPSGSAGTCTARSGGAASPFGRQAHLLVFADIDEIGRSALPSDAPRHPPARASANSAVGRDDAPSRSTTAAMTPALPSRSPVGPRSRASPRWSADRAAAPAGSRQSSNVACAPTRSTSTGVRPPRSSIPAHAAGAVAPGHRSERARALARIVVGGERERRPSIRRSDRDRPH